MKYKGNEKLVKLHQGSRTSRYSIDLPDMTNQELLDGVTRRLLWCYGEIIRLDMMRSLGRGSGGAICGTSLEETKHYLKMGIDEMKQRDMESYVIVFYHELFGGGKGE